MKTHIIFLCLAFGATFGQDCFKQNVSLMGKKLSNKNLQTKSAEECLSKCEAEKGCTGMVYYTKSKKCQMLKKVASNTKQKKNVVSAILLECQNTESSSSLIVSTTLGEVEGTILSTENEGSSVKFKAYRDIPYAQPPTGTRRFLRPVAAQPWEGILDATKERHISCPQTGFGGHSDGLSGSEDCLYLSVYTPVTTPTTGLPVMVWIHGGGYVSGSGSFSFYGPERLMEYGVVVVTINYRIGALGFLSLGTPEVSGNQGLFDQLMALEWIRDNIASFGGDPDKVTLFGESAGSTSVFSHVLSPRSEGLFSRAIGQSGTTLAPWGGYSLEEANRTGQALAAQIGCSGPDQLSCLQTKAFGDVIINNNDWSGRGDPPKPCVDGGLADVPFFPTSTREIVESGDFNEKGVEMMFGVNKDEGLMYTSPAYEDEEHFLDLYTNWDIIGAKFLFSIPIGEETPKDVEKVNKVTEFYMGSKTDYFSSLNSFTEMVGDNLFWWGLHDFIGEHTARGGKIFQYLFTYEGEHSIGPPGVGVAHADELFYLFKPLWGQQYDLNAQDKLMSEKLLRMWTNFAKFGDPSKEESFTWTPHTSLDKKYLNISYTPHMDYSVDYQQRMAVWDSVMKA